jgi:hypothetical protein
MFWNLERDHFAGFRQIQFKLMNSGETRLRKESFNLRLFVIEVKERKDISEIYIYKRLRPIKKIRNRKKKEPQKLFK